MKKLCEKTSCHRQKEKELSRLNDESSIQSGEKTLEELRKENGLFNFPNSEICWDEIKDLY